MWRIQLKEKSVGKRVELFGKVSTKYWFKMGRYLEKEVEGVVRKGVKMVPAEYSEKRSEKTRGQESWSINIMLSMVYL